MPAFPPVISNDSRVLILGSMPGQVSLEQHQYYAHPRNSFWWIMSKLYGFESACMYEDRCSALINSKVAVWDVLYDCTRPGSLDSSIDRQSESVNDFVAFFDEYKAIKRVIFNGVAAHKIFQRHYPYLLETLLDARDDFHWACCPSTSPAHAALTKHDKLKLWADAIA